MTKLKPSKSPHQDYTVIYLGQRGFHNLKIMNGDVYYLDLQELLKQYPETKAVTFHGCSNIDVDYVQSFCSENDIYFLFCNSTGVNSGSSLCKEEMEKISGQHKANGKEV
jgi:hypothetical protein